VNLCQILYNKLQRGGGGGGGGVYKSADPSKFEAKSDNALSKFGSTKSSTMKSQSRILTKLQAKSTSEQKCWINPQSVLIRSANRYKIFSRSKIWTFFSAESDNPKTYCILPPSTHTHRLQYCVFQKNIDNFSLFISMPANLVPHANQPCTACQPTSYRMPTNLISWSYIHANQPCPSQGRRKQCGGVGQPFQKGTCFSAAVILLGGNIC
jgi:hypothetical protein